MATEAWVKVIAGTKDVDTVGLTAASAAVFNAGAQLINSSGTATIITTDSDDATFIGIAGGNSLSGQTAEIPIHRKCIVNAPLASANYTYGQPLKSDIDSSDIYTFVADGGAETIVWFNQVDENSITRGDIYVNVFMLKKFYAVNA